MDRKIRAVLLDFDGTFLDSGPGIISSAKEATRRMGWSVPPDDAYRQFIGPPLAHSFVSVLGVSEEDARTAAELYKRIYDETGAIHDACVYPGMIEVLQKLRANGIRTGIASAKRVPLLRKMLEMYGGADLMDVCEGAPASGAGADKADTLRKAAQQLGLEPEEILMVGDTDYDARAARDVGMPFCGVTWGFGFETPEDAQMVCPDAAVAEKTGDLLHIVLGDSTD